MEKVIKIILAVFFFLCLLEWNYGFYQFVRYLGMVGFTILAFKESERKKHNLVFLYIALAILFQPIIKISLGRTIWNIIDVVVGIGLLVSAIKSPSRPTT